MTANRTIGLLVLNGPLPPPYGGVATYLEYTLPFLATHGFDVHTVMDRKPLNREEYAAFEKAGIRIHYTAGSRLAKIWQIIMRTPLWLKAWRETGIDFFTLVRGIKSIAGWMDAAARVMERHRIEIVHAYDYPWAQGYAALHASSVHRAKFVQSIFGEVVPHRSEVIHHDEMGDRFKSFSRFVLEHADVILSCSRHCAREIAHVGMDPQRVRVAYYGIDTTQYVPGLDGRKIRDHYGLAGKPLILFQGHMRLRKGPQVLLDAAPEILKAFPDAVFLLVGPDFGLGARLAQRADELGVRDNFRILGEKPESELPFFFAACDIFVFPSCTPIECLGLTTVKAMACGKPAVGSNINGVPEVIIDQSTGFLVEPNNPAALAEKVILLLKDESLRRRMGAAGRERALLQFDREKLARELVDIYHHLLSATTETP